MRYDFGEHSLDVDRQELRRGSEQISIEPQVFDLIVYLLRNRDRVVSRDDMIVGVWAGRIVSDSAVTTRINAARRALGDSGTAQMIIRTVQRKGVRFIADVSGIARRRPQCCPHPSSSNRNRPLPNPRSWSCRSATSVATRAKIILLMR